MITFYLRNKIDKSRKKVKAKSFEIIGEMIYFHDGDENKVEQTILACKYWKVYGASI